MELIVTPTKESYWYGGVYRFKIEIGSEYPQIAPKVVCLTTILHPNIDY